MWVPEPVIKGRKCRCGRRYILDDENAVIHNDIVHETMDIKDGFCGPVVDHNLRDTQKKLQEVKVAAEELLRVLRVDGGFDDGPENCQRIIDDIGDLGEPITAMVALREALKGT